MPSISEPQEEELAPETPEMVEETPPITDDVEEVEPMPEEAAPILLPQTTVLYLDSRFGPFECQNCCYFNQPDSCSVVAGNIDPLGVCNLFCPPNHEEEGTPIPEERPIEDMQGEEPEIEDTPADMEEDLAEDELEG